MQLAMIWAQDLDGVIGKDGGLPWRLPAEMKWFRKCTLGKPIIAGRKTFESFGKALPRRTNVVVTRQPGFAAPDAIVCASLVEALDTARGICASSGVEEAVVVGGAEIYRLALPLADRLYVTTVDARVDGDTRFEFDRSDFSVASAWSHDPDDANAYGFRAGVLERLARASE